MSSRMHSRRAVLVSALAGLLGLAAAACGSSSSSTTTTAAPKTTPTTAAVTSTVAPATTKAPAATGAITVFAAASLSEAFKEVGTAFEAANPAAKVTFSFAASSALATQINQLAPADVFASADTANMDKVTAAAGAGTLAPPVTLATNKLQIIVGKGNPKAIASLADLSKPGLLYVTAAAGVPIGTYAQQALDKAKVTVTPKSLEADVKGIVTKVTLGEADAGIVYATDVKAAGDKAQGVVIPEDQQVTATYPIAVVKSTKNAATAQAFVAFLTGTAGKAILTKYGFATT